MTLEFPILTQEPKSFPALAFEGFTHHTVLIMPLLFTTLHGSSLSSGKKGSLSPQPGIRGRAPISPCLPFFTFNKMSLPKKSLCLFCTWPTPIHTSKPSSKNQFFQEASSALTLDSHSPCPALPALTLRAWGCCISSSPSPPDWKSLRTRHRGDREDLVNGAGQEGHV